MTARSQLRAANASACVWLALSVLVAAGVGVSLAREKKRSPEERKSERLGERSRQLKKLAARQPLTPENQLLHDEAARLLERARQAPAGSYQLDRLDSAIDALLDSSEEILKAQQAHQGDEDDDDQRETARDLERTYFRVQQGDYFARQAKEANAPEYLRVSRRLYQMARSAYDSREYRRARRLAAAAREIISGLEALAQAAAPIPEPPPLPQE